MHMKDCDACGPNCMCMLGILFLNISIVIAIP